MPFRTAEFQRTHQASLERHRHQAQLSGVAEKQKRNAFFPNDASPARETKCSHCGCGKSDVGVSSNVEFQASPDESRDVDYPPTQDQVMASNNYRDSFAADARRPHEQMSSMDRRKAFNRVTFSATSERFVDNIHVVRDSAPVSRLNTARKHIGKIVNDERVTSFVLLLIIINAIMMGVATFPAIKQHPNILSKFELIDKIFLVVFTFEAAMQLIYHGWTVFKDGFLVFDLAIVVLSWALEGVQGARAFRIFRAFRLIARIRTMKNLILALISVIPNLSGILMLMLLMFYIFGVSFTMLYKDASSEYDRKEQYFVALPDTLFTLFQMLTLDGWTKVFRQAYSEYFWSWILFVAFVTMSSFIFVNLIIAVICDAVKVMSDRGMAGLTGCDEDEIKIERSRDPLHTSPVEYNQSTCLRRQKLRELERRIDDIALMQNELLAVLNNVVTKSRKDSNCD